MDTPESLFDGILNIVSQYMHKDEHLNLIIKAYHSAYEKHQGQVRRSGEPYIIHPLAVAEILASLGVGPNTIVAGFLHDVVEDTDVTLEDVKEVFNEDVMTIVDGLTKIRHLRFDGNLEQVQRENHQKMLLAMAKDIRVIIVKLADRLHNMRTMSSMPPNRQIEISRETLEIYAPLAHKLGMFKIKAELEDRALRYTDPEAYHRITMLIKTRKAHRESLINEMIGSIESHLKTSQINDYQIKGRIKNIYSIYKKMIKSDKDFSEIYDLLAIRVIVDKLEDCYQVLGIIHANYIPIPKRFKDYVAVPKPNMYQSLHTTVIGDDGQIFEIQIRTKEMDKIAEYGVAAHWAYKENVEYSKEREQFEIANKLKWYGDLLKISEDKETSENAEEFVGTIKADILDANIYVFTPKSEVIALPKGGTPIDFAYRIHTDIGDKTVGAIVNNKIVPLDYELQTGDILSIKTSKNSFGPSEDWLKFVKTSHAKAKIKAFLNKQNRSILVENGKSAVFDELNQSKEDYPELTDDFARKTFGKNGNINDLEDMYFEVGKGLLSEKTVVSKLLGTEFDSTNSLKKQMANANRILTTNSETGVVVEGLSNPQIRLGNCCNPIPGDEIMGYVSKGNGIIVHTQNCPNLLALKNERLLRLDWATNTTRKYPVRIKISSENKNNIFADIINTINASNLSIASVNATTTGNFEMIFKMKLLTLNTNELDKLIINLKKISGIYQIERDNK